MMSKSFREFVNIDPKTENETKGQSIYDLQIDENKKKGNKK